MTILNADRWIFSKLTEDQQLSTALGGRVFSEIAPLDSEYPLSTFTLVSSQQVSNLSSDRIMDTEIWQITIWDNENSYSRIEGIADRIRQVLHKDAGEGVIGCTFERQQRITDHEGYRGVILEFRLFTQ
ncbi:MAG: DUF3168 domain-containing protein [Candidatus Methanomethylicaceae archaeon]